ncbi:TolC family protein [Olleya marilimosa]|uniref:TolC family protein n=1 Tax=Olleya marilimosa TaxID=272164 RepID=A0ABR8LNX4_9FLAO|nr:TolC family protein [Olleya marilimosa]MBD3861919.1 TolC family protein [Olleya marilimosa]MBD3889419.1 TolC family protein [Olleya marilimosa]
MKKVILFIAIIVPIALQSQTLDSLSYAEFLGYVKQYHPVAKQADLLLESGQASLMKARGGFDPKLEADFNEKDYKNTEYYERLNATFKVPTWYGIDLKANFEENTGYYLNPENTVPDDGLFSAGIGFSLGQGLLMNKRMADVKKAKFFKAQTQAERNLQVNQILYDASIAYFDWLQAYNETKIYERFLENASIRFEGVRSSVLAGDKAGIDSLEAGIVVKNRSLELEQAKVKLLKTRLEASNFIWLNNTPVDINQTVSPMTTLEEDIDVALGINTIQSYNVDNHPKLLALGSKIDGLDVDRQLKANKLLPVIDAQYNFLSETPDQANSFNASSYKATINVAFPLFLRKERGDLKLSKLKLQDAQFTFADTQLQIKNKIEAITQELESYKTQNNLIKTIVADYQTLLSAEERKFSFGESSVFLINSRENKLIESQVKAIKVNNKFNVTKAKLFNSLGLVPN